MNRRVVKRYTKLFGQMVEAEDGRYVEAVDYDHAQKVLSEIRDIVCEAAEVGFNYADGGDWVERLYAKNGDITRIIGIEGYK